MKVLFPFIFLLICFVSNSQNFYRFSQFNLVKSLYNPGALASDASFTSDLIYRNQWAGVDGAPSTIGFNSAYELTNEMAVGINFYSDRIGLNQTNSFSAMYAYRLIFEEQKYLSFGLGIGADNVASNFASATTIQANDPAFSQSYSRFFLNASFGLYYRTTTFYVGLSIPQLIQNSTTKKEMGFLPIRWHYMFQLGYFLEVSDNFIFNPNIQFKSSLNTPIQGDFLLRGITNNLGFSIGYRSENSLIAGMDYTFFQKFRIGYAINHDVGSLARTKGFSHEVYLGLGLPYYSNGDSFENRKYVSKKGGSKTNYKRQYFRKNRKY